MLFPLVPSTGTRLIGNFASAPQPETELVGSAVQQAKGENLTDLPVVVKDLLQTLRIVASFRLEDLYGIDNLVSPLGHTTLVSVVLGY